ncbi:MAG TPA: type II secretion system protein [Candidatus Dormibacteraeota bacterium]|nr:type II secretion system protein [Candidatus Dormibacteraeota bacterium]
MLIELLRGARKRSHRSQGGFTLVELLVVIAILGILAAIVLFNISGVNANAACNGMKTDGATIQAAADLYYNNTGKYPVGPPPVAQVDTATPPNLATVNLTELLTANLLHQAPSAVTEKFTYVVSASYGNGTVQGNMVPVTTCIYNP